MSTRSTVSIQYDDGSIKTIYCHFDGHLTSLGSELISKFNTKDKVIKLIDEGPYTSIYGGIEKLREDLTGFINHFKSHKDYMQNCPWEEYNYLFRKGQWRALWDNNNVQLGSYLKLK